MEYKVPPWAHQHVAVENAKDVPGYGLFFEQGCGKTPTCINILRHKYEQHKRVLPTFILCPPIVVENWRREWLRHSDLREDQIITLTGSGFARNLEFVNRVLKGGEGKVVITNYEALYMADLYSSLLKWMPTCMVLDESQKCKDLTAKRTKKAIDLGKRAMYKYILSGTPTIRDAFDIFSQFLFLDNGETFTPNYRDFRAKYFVDRNAYRPKQTYFPDWEPRSGALQEINSLIYKKSMRVLIKHCLDMPPLIQQKAEFELTGEQLKFYTTMQKDAVAFQNIDGKSVVTSADLAIKKALRLQQVTTGHVTSDDGEVRQFSPNPRINALEEVLSQIGGEHKIIIWANFKQNYKDIAGLLEHLRINYVEVTGEVDSKTKQAAIDSFNSPRGRARVLIGHPASCGIGANLTAARYAIFYSRGFSLEDHLQAKARNYRGGSEIHETIIHVDLIAKNTIDEVVTQALADKTNVADTILKYLGARK